MHRARNLEIKEKASKLSYITPIYTHLEYSVYTHTFTKVQTNTHKNM